jgi:hypothetical protein
MTGGPENGNMAKSWGGGGGGGRGTAGGRGGATNGFGPGGTLDHISLGDGICTGTV